MGAGQDLEAVDRLHEGGVLEYDTLYHLATVRHLARIEALLERIAAALETPAASAAPVETPRRKRG